MFGEKELNELYAVEEVCFSGEVSRERFLAETADPMYITVAEKRGGVIVAFALGRVVADEGELYQIGVLDIVLYDFLISPYCIHVGVAVSFPFRRRSRPLW